VGCGAIACYILRTHTNGCHWSGDTYSDGWQDTWEVKAATRPWLWQDVLAWKGHSGRKEHEGL
jgi:hypothetical protein